MAVCCVVAVVWAAQSQIFLKANLSVNFVGQCLVLLEVIKLINRLKRKHPKERALSLDC